MRARMILGLVVMGLAAGGCAVNDSLNTGAAGPPAAGGAPAPSPPVVAPPPTATPTPAPMTPAPGAMPPAGPAPVPAPAPVAPRPAPPPCEVKILPQNPPRLIELLAGPASRLRVRAQASGPAAPAAPNWRWEVLFENLSPVSHTVAGSADVIEIPLRSSGPYYIRAEAVAGCSSTITAVAASPSDRIATFWLRVSPPRVTGLPAQDTTIAVGGQYTPAKNIALERGLLVRIDPHDRNDNAIGSFIRVSSPQSTVRFEGHNKNSNTGFVPALLPLLSYDVLVVPDGPVAPALFRSFRPAQLVAPLFTLDPGVAVTGELRAGAGAGVPVAGARVLLRAGSLPSTIGSSDLYGQFELRARSGVLWGAVVLPPPGSSLPEAQLPEVIDIGGSAAPLRFQWRALPSARLDLAVLEPGGQATSRPVRVRIEAVAGSLPDVGSLLIGASAPVPASGFLRLESMTGAGGVASFAGVPSGRYLAIAIPPDGATGLAVTSALVEAGSAQTQRIALTRPVTVSGKVFPAVLSAGLRVIALDTETHSPGDLVSTTVDIDGQFVLALPADRSYRLQIEPAQERRLPRLFLGEVTATGNTILPDVIIAEGVTFIGTVTVEQSVVPGAVVQVYCTGLPPDCVDPLAPETDAARPVGETVTGPDGRFQVHLPDPSRWTF
jgi:hypothetical protein